MFGRGRSQGWLNLPIETLASWSSFNGIKYNGISVGTVPGLESRGSAIRVNISSLTEEQNPLMTVPGDLIVSKDNVYLQAKSDEHLREVLDAVGEFAQTARGAILIFMLLQATHNCPDIPETIGTSCAFSHYIKFLPHVPLPTFWSDEELELLKGTSLAPAIDTKMKSLYREFDHLREATIGIDWCRKYWWDEVDGLITFGDWKHVDAAYRSRALEYPGIGDCMVPCIDMANHASGEGTGALYESNAEGDGLLLLRDGRHMAEGDEITITYGDEKGACEMIFSYGFIEESMINARDLLLGMDIPDDDPLKRAKKAISNSAPGVRLLDSSKSGLQWKSDFVWLICVNEEDGLAFEIAQTIDGERELQVTFNNRPLDDPSKLQSILEDSPLWEVYHLRAVSVIQDRVGEQLQVLLDVQHMEIHDEVDPSSAKSLALKLRTLELDLLERFYDFLEDEKNRLFETQVVQEYLASAKEDVEDFS